MKNTIYITQDIIHANIIMDIVNKKKMVNITIIIIYARYKHRK